MKWHNDPFMTGVEWFIGLTIVGLVGLIIYGAYVEYRHPCVRYGEPHVVNTLYPIYNGKTTTFIPTTQVVRDCLEREP